MDVNILEMDLNVSADFGQWVWISSLDLERDKALHKAGLLNFGIKQ